MFYLVFEDTFKESVSTLLERKVRGWLTGVIDDMRRSSPVQQWLDSLPAEGAVSEISEHIDNETDNSEIVTKSESDDEKHIQSEEVEQKHDDSCLEVPSSKEAWKQKSLETGVQNSTSDKKGKKLQRDYSIQSEGCSPKAKNPLLRDYSLQSDGSGSSGSSVLNVLGARKVDAESVLLALGFGPSEKQQKLQRIPDRFLQPSKLNGISTEQFIKDEQHSMRMHDCGIFGYRGLTGNPHVPPSTIVAKIMERILQDDLCREQASIKARHSVADIRSAMALAQKSNPLARRDT